MEPDKIYMRRFNDAAISDIDALKIPLGNQQGIVVENDKIFAFAANKPDLLEHKLKDLKLP